MTDQARTPTTTLVKRMETAARYACDPECEGRCAVCPADALREAAAALLAAEQREQALREMLTREEHLVGAARSVLSNYENEDGVIPYAKVIDDMRFLALAVLSATGEQP